MTMKRMKSTDIEYFRGNYHFTLLSLYYLHSYFKSLPLGSVWLGGFGGEVRGGEG